MKKLLIPCIISFLVFLSSCSESPQVAPEVSDIAAKEVAQDPKTTQEIVFETPDEPSFSEVDIRFEHNYDDKQALAFLGGTFLDIDADGNNEFLITGGADQNDGVFSYKNGNIVDITSQTGINNTIPSYGAYSIDFDENGYDDVFIARQDGVYYYKNENGVFTETKLDISLPKNTIPLDIDFADIDGDNDLDMYVSTFIHQTLFRAAVFNDPNHVQQNLLLQNNGDLSFTDITVSSGLDVAANTFTASFVDLDNDLDPDIVISPNTDTVQIYRNTGGEFKQVYQGSLYGFWMGLALSDADNDGDIDIFFSNVGTSIPEKFLGGDSRADQIVKSQYLFLENTGDMSFTEKKDSTFEDLGFGWGIVPTDTNLDNQTDYLIMQNYIKWAPHKLKKLSGELLVQSNGGFKEKIKDYGIRNKAYGISALVGDINHDGFDDIVYLNLNGSPAVHIRSVDTKNRFLKVNLPNTQEYLSAKLELISSGEMLAEKYFLPKQGLMTKQDSAVVFGLNGEMTVPDTLRVTLINNQTQERDIGGSNTIDID